MSKRVRKEDLTEDNARPAKVHKKAAPSVAPMEVDSDQTDVKQVAGHHGFALVKGPAAVINELKSAGAVTKLLRELNELIGEFCGGYSQPLLCTSLGDEPWSVAQIGNNRLLVPVRGRGSEKLVELDVTTGQSSVACEPVKDWPAMEKFACHNGRRFLFGYIGEEDDAANVCELEIESKTAVDLPRIKFTEKQESCWYSGEHGRLKLRIDHFEGLIVFANGSDSKFHYFFLDLAFCPTPCEKEAFVICSDGQLLSVPHTPPDDNKHDSMYNPASSHFRRTCPYIVFFRGDTERIKEIGIVPHTQQTTHMALLLRPEGWTVGSFKSREVLLLNEFKRGNEGDDLRAVNLETGEIRVAAPYAVLCAGAEKEPRFGAIVVDQDPSRNTAYIVDCANARIIAVRGL